MEQNKLYNASEIEQLKQELQSYKHSFEYSGPHESLNYFVHLKRELHDMQLELSRLKGEVNIMKEEFQKKVEDSEEQKENHTVQIQSIADSLNQLQHDLTTINQNHYQTQVTDLLDKMESIINRTEKNRTTLKDLGHESSKQNANSIEQKSTKAEPRMSEYRRLQNMLQSMHQANPQNANTSAYTNQKFNQNKSFHNKRNPSSATNQGKSSKSNHLEFNKNVITKVTKPQDHIQSEPSTNQQQSNAKEKLPNQKHNQDMDRPPENTNSANQQIDQKSAKNDSISSSHTENEQETKSRLNRPKNKRNLSSIWASIVEKLR